LKMSNSAMGVAITKKEWAVPRLNHKGGSLSTVIQAGWRTLAWLKTNGLKLGRFGIRMGVHGKGG
jgi:hypothetical protein